MIIITSINHTQILCYDVFISIFACQIPGQRYLLLIIFYITASIPLILIPKSSQLQNTLIMLLALLSTCMVIKYSDQGKSQGHKLHGNKLICGCGPPLSNFEPHSQTQNHHHSPSKPTISHAKIGKNNNALKVLTGIVPMSTRH